MLERDSEKKKDCMNSFFNQELWKYMKVLALHLKCRPKAKCKAHLCQPSVGNKKYLPSLFFLMMVYTKRSQLWTLESFTTWSSRFINHSSKIMWMFYQQLTWNVSLCEWEELPVLGLFSSCQMPLTVLNTAQQRKYGLLCYIQNVEMHFRNDIRTGWLCVHNMSTLDATLSEWLQTKSASI